MFRRQGWKLAPRSAGDGSYEQGRTHALARSHITLLPFIPLSVYALILVSESPGSKLAAPRLHAHAVGILVLVPILVFYSPGAMQWTRFHATWYRASWKLRNRRSRNSKRSTRNTLWLRSNSAILPTTTIRFTGLSWCFVVNLCELISHHGWTCNMQGFRRRG